MSTLSCLEILRAYDRDRYLTVLLAPKDKREALAAIYAFNHEIAKTREVVSETTMGLIRLTWWREAIEEIYADKPARSHDVVIALHRAIQTYNLPQKTFEMLIYGREFDLEDQTPSDFEGLLKYTHFTTAPLIEFGQIIMHGEKNSPAAQVSAEIIALMGLLRAIPWHAQQHRCYLPADLLQKHDLSPHDIYAMKCKNNLKPVIKTVADHIRENLAIVSFYTIDTHTLLQIDLARQYLGTLEKCDYNVLDARLQRDPPLCLWRLLYRKWRRKL